MSEFFKMTEVMLVFALVFAIFTHETNTSARAGILCFFMDVDVPGSCPQVQLVFAFVLTLG